MGKKTDRMYITMREWTEDFGGKINKYAPEGSEFKPLPFFCCSLSLQPFEDPMCTPDGVLYDITNITPWLKKYKVDPITGKELQSSDLFKVHFHKNEKGNFHCPITFKEFTEFTHIVTIKTSGHVFSWEAIDELNIKAKNMKCLITGNPFTKEDIITIQDPKNLERRNLSSFHHIKMGMKVEDFQYDPSKNISIPASTRRALQAHKVEQDKEEEKKKAIKEAELREAPKRSSDKFVEVPAQAPGFTSTQFSSKMVKVDAREIILKTDKKGYVRLSTSLGDINIELHCDLAPKTCENFLLLAERKYYDGTIFHRLLPGFMIQGGDPTGTGTGGQSAWGKPIKDEFHNKLQHHTRGILSMANSGKDSNGSQFFITFAATPHLNLKHSVFGRVVGGNEVLSKMEQVKVDKSEKPLQPITLNKVTIFVNPFNEDPDELKARKEEEEKKKKEQEEGKKLGQWYSNPAGAVLPTPVKTSGVGKYIQRNTTTPSTSTTTNLKRSTPPTSADASRPTKKQT